MTKIKGNVANLIPKLFIGIIILVLLVAVVFLSFTQFKGSERSFACAIGLEKCEEDGKTPSHASANLVSAIRCAYYRCESGCNSPVVQGINIEILNKDGGLITVNCKADLCLPYADSNNKVCDPTNGTFAVSYQKSGLDVRLFEDKEFDSIDLNDKCEQSAKISLKKADIAKDSEGKDLCEYENRFLWFGRVVKSCELNTNIYEIKSGVILPPREPPRKFTSACSVISLGESKSISIPKFSLSIQPTSIPADGEFQLTFGGFPSTTKSIMLVFDKKDRKTYTHDSTDKVITKTFKVGQDIPNAKGSFTIQLKAIGQFGNVVGITDLREINIE